RRGANSASLEDSPCRQPAALPPRPARAIARGIAPMTVSTAQALLDDLRRAQLLNAAQLETVQAECGHLTEPQQLVQELVRRNFLTPFQADQVLQGPAQDLNFGSYRLLDVIGEGGMGSTCK